SRPQSRLAADPRPARADRPGDGRSVPTPPSTDAVKNPLDNLVIVGVGLLGGSLAWAARARGLARHVIGVEPCEERRRRIGELRMVTGTEAEIEPAARVA